MRWIALPLMLTIAACSTPSADLAKLAPRAGETVDPRLPVEPLRTATPVSPVVTARIAALSDQAEGSLPAFDAQIATAANLANGAGAKESESWVAAQQSLSAAIALRGPLMVALGDLDAMLDADVAADGRVSSSDREAILAASAKLKAVAEAQQGKVDAVEALLRR